MKTCLQACRKKAGYKSAKDFAEKIGMKLATYTDYEQGRRKIALEKAWEFADVLGCTLDELAGRDFHPPQGTILSGTEQELIGLYRDTNAQGKATIMGVARIQPGMEGQSEADAHRSA